MAAKKIASRGLVDAALRAAADLEGLGASFAIVGGLAIGARAEPRFTRDVDFAVAVESDEEAEHTIRALIARGYRVDVLVEHRTRGRLATARLRHDDLPGVFVDLLFASSGVEPEVVANAETLAYRPGAHLPVARIGHLLALKALSESDERLQDRLDLRALANVCTAEDWRLAESTAREIRARGFHRGRALVKRLRRWRAAEL
jgi:hypothetical protein